MKIFSLLNHITKKFNNIKLNKIYFSIIGFFFILTILSYKNIEINMDISEYLNNAYRIFNKDLPYKDFWLLFPPGEVYIPFFILKFLGMNINYIFIFCFVINFLTFIVSFEIGRIIFKNNFFSLLASLLIFSSGLPSQFVGYPFYIFFLFGLVSFCFLLKYFRNKKTIMFFLSSIFLSIAFIFRIYESIPIFISLCSFIFLKFEKWSEKIKYTFIYLISVIFFIFFLYLPFLNISNYMIDSVLIQSVKHATSSKILYFDSFFNHFSFLKDSLSKLKNNFSFLILSSTIFHLFGSIRSLTLYILPFFILFSTFYYIFILKKIKKEEKCIVIFFLIFGFLFFPKVLNRGQMYNLTYALTPLYFLFIFYFNIFFNKKTFLKYIFLSITIIILLMLPIYLSRVLYNFLFAEKITTDHGNVFIKNKNKIDDFKEIFYFIKNNTEYEDFIFDNMGEFPIYLLTERRNPTYYDSIVDIWFQPNETKQKKLCDDIISKKTKIIIYFNGSFDEKDNSTFSEKLPIIDKCIKDNFKKEKKLENYLIYIKIKNFV